MYMFEKKVNAAFFRYVELESNDLNFIYFKNSVLCKRNSWSMIFDFHRYLLVHSQSIFFLMCVKSKRCKNVSS